MDDSSIDGTTRLPREAGARVITSALLGKGARMPDGMTAGLHESVVHLDGDLSSLRPGIASDPCRPLCHGGADFAPAHLLQFDNEACTGALLLNPAFMPIPVDTSHPGPDEAAPGVLACRAVGDDVNDLGLLLQAADRACAMTPRSPRLTQVPGLTVVASCADLLAQVPEAGLPAAAAQALAGRRVTLPGGVRTVVLAGSCQRVVPLFRGCRT